MRRTVLLVEDESAIAEVVEMYLEDAGFNFQHAPSGAEARRRFGDPALDLVLLDLMLPDADGLDLVRELRDQRRALPVIMLTARDAEADRVLGLELGADDYVTKPFSPRELVARVRAVLRRGAAEEADGERRAVTSGSLRVDPVRHEVMVAGDAVDLTRKEFDLLLFLVARPGRVFTRSQLLEQVWDYPGDIDSRTVDVHVGQLRKKLGGFCPVRTVRGVGYKADS